MRILVTGATGQVGRHLVRQLLDAGHHVRALTRRPESADLPAGTEIVGGDLADLTSVGGIFRDVDAAHLITFGGDWFEPLPNGAELAKLAEVSGVRRATVLGGWDASTVESGLDETAIDWALLSPLEFMANTLAWSDEIRAHGTVSTMATFASAAVHEADIAQVAASLLTAERPPSGNHFISGPEALTPAERTAILAEVTGRPISFVELDEAAERARLQAQGQDADDIEFAVQLATNPPDVAHVVRDTVPELTGKPGRTYRTWAEENVAAFLPRP